MLTSHSVLSHVVLVVSYPHLLHYFLLHSTHSSTSVCITCNTCSSHRSFVKCQLFEATVLVTVVPVVLWLLLPSLTLKGQSWCTSYMKWHCEHHHINWNIRTCSNLEMLSRSTAYIYVWQNPSQMAKIQHKFHNIRTSVKFSQPD